MKKILVVAAIIKKDNKILIVQRKTNCKREPNKWEFPGGKIEIGERPEQCLIREIKEELDLDIVVGELFGESSKKYEDEEIGISYYFAKLKNNNKPKLIECQDVRWVLLEELCTYDFASADMQIPRLLILNK
ncbi:MAG: (deoxy)nucleoside triphosphate pyrophosphohydrolase [Candidatus Micrarchaeota archaeon]